MKQVTAILAGAGQRGRRAYASYALDYPNELKFVAVAEPDKERREAFQREHNIPEEHCYSGWEELLEQPKMADCILICTMDNMHYEPVKKAAEKGYHILCEKPMSSSRAELEDMGRIAKESGKVFSICHVLRYSPFFGELKRLLDGGAVGELVSIQHIESVGFWHMAHSFVRGNWRNSEESSSMILQKCCHDMDILLWLVGSHCSRVSSFGSLTHFKEENAPENAPLRCMDGCSHRDECPYFAPRFYLEHKHGGGFAKALTLDTSREGILKALKEGPYGRCVYHCDNNVVDHQVINLEFENGVTANMTMCAFTNEMERVINLMGTRGQIRGNMEENYIEVMDFVTGHRYRIDVAVPESGHSGSDSRLMKEFTALVAADGKGESLSNAAEAVESHIIALAAEESRLKNGEVIQLKKMDR
ncbi:MAG: Gfo/Idh/MocA family oxidoreductase [Clostridiales bacterium]|nr:Gfo/Idh/MocA family oxidoreductase [Clostridiales bacterium]